MKNDQDIRLQYYHRMVNENVEITDNYSYNNFFVVLFPKELNIRYYDVVSCENIGDKTFRFTINNNFDNYPLFSLNEYVQKYKNIFKKNNDVIEIQHINKKGYVEYITTLKNIKLCNIQEGSLSYYDNNIQRLTFDIKYKTRIIEKNGPTNKES